MVKRALTFAREEGVTPIGDKCYRSRKGDMFMTSTIGIKLDEQTKERLKRLGAVRSRSPHWLMCLAIRQYLDREEKYEREKREDMERWERFELTGRSVSHDSAAAWLTNLAEGKDATCPA
jgi:predicted transcriptional regulator